MKKEKTIKKHLLDYFEAMERVLSDQFDLSTGASGGHIGAMGENREKILIDFLAKHIPFRFTIEQRGIIFDKNYNKSSQVDIIIYEHNYPRLGGQSPTLYFIEGVGGCLEVKSTLGKKELEDGIKNIASFKKLEESPTNMIIGNISQPDLLFGGIFAFKNKLNEDEILKILNDSKLEKKLLPDFVYSNDGLFLIKSDQNFLNGELVKQDLIFISSEHTKLFHFLIHISRYVIGKNLVPIDLKEYFNQSL